MKYFVIFYIVFSGYAFSQTNLTCKVLVAQSKLNKNKEFLFRLKMCTTLKLKHGTVLHVPEIIEISLDTIKLINRGIYAEKNNLPISIAINEIKWINWDGIPRKKIRSRYYRFEVEERSGLDCNL